jgi:hypothetical protein
MKYCLGISVIVVKDKVKIQFICCKPSNFKCTYRDYVELINDGKFPLYLDSDENKINEIKKSFVEMIQKLFETLDISFKVNRYSIITDNNPLKFENKESSTCKMILEFIKTISKPYQDWMVTKIKVKVNQPIID